MRTRSLGFLSFAHQEGDLGFVRAAISSKWERRVGDRGADPLPFDNNFTQERPTHLYKRHHIHKSFANIREEYSNIREYWCEYSRILDDVQYSRILEKVRHERT